MEEKIFLTHTILEDVEKDKDLLSLETTPNCKGLSKIIKKESFTIEDKKTFTLIYLFVKTFDKTTVKKLEKQVINTLKKVFEKIILDAGENPNFRNLTSEMKKIYFVLCHYFKKKVQLIPTWGGEEKEHLLSLLVMFVKKFRTRDITSLALSVVLTDISNQKGKKSNRGNLTRNSLSRTKNKKNGNDNNVSTLDQLFLHTFRLGSITDLSSLICSNAATHQWVLNIFPHLNLSIKFSLLQDLVSTLLGDSEIKNEENKNSPSKESKTKPNNKQRNQKIYTNLLTFFFQISNYSPAFIIPFLPELVPISAHPKPICRRYFLDLIGNILIWSEELNEDLLSLILIRLKDKDARTRVKALKCLIKVQQVHTFNSDAYLLFLDSISERLIDSSKIKNNHKEEEEEENENENENENQKDKGNGKGKEIKEKATTMKRIKKKYSNEQENEIDDFIKLSIDEEEDEDEEEEKKKKESKNSNLSDSESELDSEIDSGSDQDEKEKREEALKTEYFVQRIYNECIPKLYDLLSLSPNSSYYSLEQIQVICVLFTHISTLTIDYSKLITCVTLVLPTDKTILNVVLTVFEPIFNNESILFTAKRLMEIAEKSKSDQDLKSICSLISLFREKQSTVSFGRLIETIFKIFQSKNVKRKLISSIVLKIFTPFYPANLRMHRDSLLLFITNNLQNEDHFQTILNCFKILSETYDREIDHSTINNFFQEQLLELFLNGFLQKEILELCFKLNNPRKLIFLTFTEIERLLFVEKSLTIKQFANFLKLLGDTSNYIVKYLRQNFDQKIKEENENLIKDGKEKLSKEQLDEVFQDILDDYVKNSNISRFIKLLQVIIQRKKSPQLVIASVGSLGKIMSISFSYLSDNLDLIIQLGKSETKSFPILKECLYTLMKIESKKSFPQILDLFYSILNSEQNDQIRIDIKCEIIKLIGELVFGKLTKSDARIYEILFNLLVPNEKLLKTTKQFFVRYLREFPNRFAQFFFNSFQTLGRVGENRRQIMKLLLNLLCKEERSGEILIVFIEQIQNERLSKASSIEDAAWLLSKIKPTNTSINKLTKLFDDEHIFKKINNNSKKYFIKHLSAGLKIRSISPKSKIDNLVKILNDKQDEIIETITIDDKKITEDYVEALNRFKKRRLSKNEVFSPDQF
ncbi:stress response protein nst1 [Anaeramoeba flamelloides]|uniref:Stress response protein nst1 n=1 Tax=Anaeramoeba flamelloides TaxID=1746091 RepID=A0AAV7Z8N9_9EUKA|nr:stress response protein nst1 [Anaeramoeba flamelloides]